jgi:hypothetical protein
MTANRKKYMREYQQNRYRTESNFRKRQLKYVREGRKKIIDEIFELLGNRCSNPDCPIPRDKLNLRALQIDHVKGNGAKERGHLKRKCAYTYYRNILLAIKVGSKDYQLLCAYCNWLKRFEDNKPRL